MPPTHVAHGFPKAAACPNCTHSASVNSESKRTSLEPFARLERIGLDRLRGREGLAARDGEWQFQAWTVTAPSGTARRVWLVVNLE